jgi:transcriptional regulator with XRE-family HTH domain
MTRQERRQVAVVAIDKMWQRGWTFDRIAETFQVELPVVSQWARGKRAPPKGVLERLMLEAEPELYAQIAEENRRALEQVKAQREEDRELAKLGWTGLDNNLELAKQVAAVTRDGGRLRVREAFGL